MRIIDDDQRPPATANCLQPTRHWCQSRQCFRCLAQPNSAGQQYRQGSKQVVRIEAPDYRAHDMCRAPRRGNIKTHSLLVRDEIFAAHPGSTSETITDYLQPAAWNAARELGAEFVV